MAEDSAKALTPPIIDIADAKIRSLSREFRDRKFWMERHLKRIPISNRFVSEWDIARGLTTLAVVCAAATTSIYGLFITRPNAYTVMQSAVQAQTEALTEPPKPAEVAKIHQKQLSQILFGGFSTQRLKTIVQDIEKEAKIFIPDPFREQARVLGSNRWASLIETVVAKPELKIPLSEQEAWSKLLRAIIYVESGGNLLAKSSIGAVGLAQIEKDSADKAAGRLGITEYDPFDPETNLTLAVKILQRNLYLFNDDLELALAAYNLGENAITGVLKTYYISVKKLPMGIVLEDFENMGKHGDTDPASRVYLQDYPVTFEDLFLNQENSPKITGYLSSVWGINKNELNFNTRVYLAAKSLFPKEISPVLHPQTKAQSLS